MANSRNHMTDVLILGAGMSGMAAASEVSRAGRSVMVVDKGRAVGGRMATRRIGEAVFDHGAQFITARSDRFTNKIREWCAQDIVREWCRGFTATADGHPRWRGNTNMKALPRHLSEGIEVLLEARVTSIRQEGNHWSVAIDDGGTITTAALLLTAPIPQSLFLIDQGNFVIRKDLRARLDAIQYERCLAVLAVLDGPSGISPPGGMVFEDGPISWLADNQLKGISPVPCVTIHASHAFSLAHWDADRDAAGKFLLDTAAPWIRSGVKEFQTHGWLFSKPLRVYDDPCAVLHAKPLLVVAGDAFAGPKVEGAACSGWAAAEKLLNHLARS